MKTGKLILIMMILVFLSGPIFAFDLVGIQVFAGKALILNAEPVENSPSPGDAPGIFGLSVPMFFTDILYFEPGLRFYTTSVVLDSAYKPVPAAIETANRISILDCELRPEIGAVFGITEKIRLGITGAPVFTFRFPVIAHDDAEGTDQKTVVRDYYFSKARFLGFYAGGFFTWDFSESTCLNLKLGTNLPIYHFWDGEDIAFYDQLIIQPEIGLIFRF